MPSASHSAGFVSLPVGVSPTSQLCPSSPALGPGTLRVFCSLARGRGQAVLVSGCREDEAAPSQLEGKRELGSKILALVLRAGQVGVEEAPHLSPGVGVEGLGSGLSSCQGPSWDHPMVLEDLADLAPLGLQPPTGAQPGACGQPQPCSHPVPPWHLPHNPSAPALSPLHPVFGSVPLTALFPVSLVPKSVSHSGLRAQIQTFSSLCFFSNHAKNWTL